MICRPQAGAEFERVNKRKKPQNIVLRLVKFEIFENSNCGLATRERRYKGRNIFVVEYSVAIRFDMQIQSVPLI